MSERITEAELSAWLAQPWANSPGEPPIGEKLSRLVAEVRRLRGLIVGAGGIEIDGPLFDHAWCQECHGHEHLPDCPVGALAAEADAITEDA
jgi:hypothetical protein